jgi:hypothetical protein
MFNVRLHIQWGARALAFFLIGAALSVPLAAKEPKTISLAAFPRVALLVCRMGAPDGVLKDIGVETDYATTVASAKQSLYIEDEARLKAAFPEYPRMFTSRVPKMEMGFYRNLTQPITGVMKALLQERGKTVVDVRDLTESLDRISAILPRLQGQAEALLVAHYMDSANGVYDAVNVARTDRGFSSLVMKLALFDVATGQRVVGKEISFNPLAIVSVDPGQKARVEVKAVDKDFSLDQGFLTKERRGLFFSISTATLITGSAEELEALALGYLRTGYDGPSAVHRFLGLNQLIQ